MENKYKVFLDGINTLEHEKIKNECMSLIYAAQKYYSEYEYHQRLKSISKMFPEIGVNKKQNMLTLTMQLYLDCYLSLFHNEDDYFDENISHRETYGGRNKYKMIAAYKDELEEIEQTFNGYGKNSDIPYILKEQNRIKKNSDEEYIDYVRKVFKNMRICCKNAYVKYRKKRIVELPSKEELQENIKLLETFSTSPKTIQSEETSFNEIFSDAYIELLLDYMKSEEGLLPLIICPIRSMLSYSEKYEREIDSRTWRWCFNKQFTQTLNKLITENKIMYENCKKTVSFYKQNKKALDILHDAQIISR